MTDIFGFETPEEAQSRILQSFTDYSRSIVASTDDPAKIWGAGMANMFGPSLQRFMETRGARKSVAQGLMQQGVPEREAKALAKQQVPSQFQAERSAEQMQTASGGASQLIQDLLEQGATPAAAQATGMMFMSQQLRQLGMQNEAAQLSLGASQVYQEEVDRLAKVDEVKAKNENLAARTAETVQNIQLKAESNDSTYAKIQDGRIVDIQSVAAGDIETLKTLRDSGYVNFGSSAMGVNFEAADAFSKGPKPLSGAEVEKIGFQLQMLDSLDLLAKIAPEVNVATPFKALLASRGVDIFGSGALIEPVAVQKSLRAGIQSIVPGIPSNYDSSVFEAIIPDLFRFQDGDIYQAQVDVLRKQTRSLVELNIAAHKGSNQPLPEHISILATRFGINVGAIRGLEGEALDAAARAHEQETLRAGRALQSIAPVGEPEDTSPDADFLRRMRQLLSQ